MRSAIKSAILATALHATITLPATAQMTPWNKWLGYRYPPPTADLCGLPERVFFENAINRMRLSNGPSRTPGQNSRMAWNGVLPHVRIGEYFWSFPSAAAYLEAHPDCCRLARPDPIGWADAFGDWPMRILGMRPRWMTPDNTVEIFVRIETVVEAEGRKALVGSEYTILLDRCAQRFEMFVKDHRLSRVDIQSIGTRTIKELQP